MCTPCKTQRVQAHDLLLQKEPEKKVKLTANAEASGSLLLCLPCFDLSRGLPTLVGLSGRLLTGF